MTSCILQFDCTLWRFTGINPATSMFTYNDPIAIKAYYSEKVFRVGSRLTSSEEVYKHDIDRDVSVIFTDVEIDVKDMILLGEISTDTDPPSLARRINDVKKASIVGPFPDLWRGMF